MQRALSSETFDVLIVGGGATGCFTARDPSLRGASAHADAFRPALD